MMRRLASGAFLSLAVVVMCSNAGCAGEKGTNVAESAPAAAVSYDVTLPEKWRPYLSAGKVTIPSAPFYGVRAGGGRSAMILRSMCGARLQWSLENLTSETVYVNVNFNSKAADGRILAKTGYGTAYELAPRQRRQIDALVPVASAQIPVVLSISMNELRVTGSGAIPGGADGLVTAPLPVSPPSFDPIVAASPAPACVTETALSSDGALALKLKNQTSKRARLCVVVAVGDPALVDWANAREGEAREYPEVAQVQVVLEPNQVKDLKIPYPLPPDHAAPLLAYTVFALDEKWTTQDDVLDQGRMTLVCRGLFDLAKAAKQGLIKLPPPVPVERRANLSEERKSKHFVFRYRPDSYAAQHIDQAVADREKAYEDLSKTLQMDVSDVVRIDLYPDMKAKGLGSGTQWTPANTVSNKHIAEVYNEQCRCDPCHELAHIFSYRFGRAGENGIVEVFAVYMEQQYADRSTIRLPAKAALEANTLTPMGQALLDSSVFPESLSIIDFLIGKDLPKFRSFYVLATRAQKVDDLERASQSVYGMSLAELDRAWRAYVAAPSR